VETVVDEVRDFIKRSGVVVPKGSKLWLSHHYGFDKFREYGAAIYECINRMYCKKILVMLPGQFHPSHRHLRKEESFICLYGDLFVKADTSYLLIPGDWVNIMVGECHSFSTDKGCVFEEISTTHHDGDSYYEDKEIDKRTEDRKTLIP